MFGDAEPLHTASAGVGSTASRHAALTRGGLLAFYRFPSTHWPKLRSTNNLERVNKEIARRSDVVGIFPNDASVIRLAGALLIEQNDEWLLDRSYLSQESLRLVLEDQPEEVGEEVAQLES